MCVVAGTWPSSDETGTSIDHEPTSIDPMPTLGSILSRLIRPQLSLSKTDFYKLEMLPDWLVCFERALLCSWWNIKEATVPPPNVPKPFLFLLVFLFFPCCLGIFLFCFVYVWFFFLVFLSSPLTELCVWRSLLCRGNDAQKAKLQ